MANVTIVPPSAQVQTVSAAGGQQAQGSAGPNLPPGSIVSGTIIGKDTGGNFLLRTTQGTISLQSNTPLTYNSDVVIQIGAGGTGTTARIISVNGEPFTAFATPEPQTSDTLSPSLQTQTSGAPPASIVPPAAETNAPALPATIRAVIISAPAAEQALSNTQAGNDNTQPVNGTNVVIRLTSAPQSTTQQATIVTTPQPTGGTVSQPTSSSVQAQAQVQQLVEDTTPANVAKLVSPQPTVLQQNPSSPTTTQPQTTPQEELALLLPESQPAPLPAPSNILYATYAKQISGSAPPPSTPAPATTANAGAITAPSSSLPSAPATVTSSPATPIAANTLQGQVTTVNTDSKTAILQTPIGDVTVKMPTLPASQLPPPGTNVTIELPANSALLSIITQTPASQAFFSSTPAPLSELATSWQTLADIINLVSTDNAPAANALLARLPQLGTDFVASTVSFISTLTEGNVRKLIGEETIDILRQTGRLDLLQKFTSEVNGLNDAYTSPTQQQTPSWQPLFLPFVYQEELQQARLYVKRDTPKKGREGGKSGNDMRFVVEVDLSELGPLQMDGLIRDRQQSTVFDLIIRSRTAFSTADQAEINAIYNSAAELTGFKGTMAFQVTYDFPVKPLDEILAYTPHGITV